jgi:ABC-2 type transport system permease protein
LEKHLVTTPVEQRTARLSALPFESVGGRRPHAVTGFFAAIGEVWSHRELLDLLVRRELKAKYKDSALGFAWTLIRPIVMLLIYYFAIGKVLGAERSIPEYAIFVFTGLTIWGLFNEIIGSNTASIVSNAGLIKKVYLPREIFPFAATGSALVNFGAQLIVLFAATIILRQFPWHLGLVYGVASVVEVIVFASAIGLLLSAVNVYLRDIQYLVEVAMLILFWTSPIVYSFSFVRNAIVNAGLPHWIEYIYLANPVTIAVLAFQKAIWIAGGQPYLPPGQTQPIIPAVYPGHLEVWLLGEFVFSLILFWVAQRVFARLQGNFAQEI